jgi:SAM-dependent methyltransferase
MGKKNYWSQQGYSGPHGVSTYINRGYKFYNFLFYFLLTSISKTERCNLSVLEVGSNVGGNLNFLAQNGFKILHGFDICKKAILHGQELYPHLVLKRSDCLDYLTSQNDNTFDIIFSVGCLINIEDKSELDEIVFNMFRLSRRYVMFKEKGLKFNNKDFSVVNISKQPTNSSNCIYFKQNSLL